MRHIIFLGLALLAFWLLNSNHYTPLMLSLGGGSIALVLFIVNRMDVVDHESVPLNLSWVKMPAYFLWLCREVVMSNLLVVKHIWLGSHSISPTFAIITASQKTDVGKVIYANSITMTPGTVTVDVVGEEMIVHSLIRENIETLQSGEMDRRVSEMEK